ncbi:MAG: aldo/keto reductase [Coriobacteriales bacterium]|nr:aldo/keto reductase [Coriobacteriales bacterium]
METLTAQHIELAPGYSISRVINGCWQLSQGHALKAPVDFDDVCYGFHGLVERGFTTFDCGDIYTGVEEFLGSFVDELKASSEGPGPDDIQIHTKYVPDLDILAQVDYAHTSSIIERSLTRLHREALDLVQFHWWDYSVPGYVETALNLLKLKEQGKIRNIGVTNFDAPHLKEIVDAGVPVVSCQSQFSMFDRRPQYRLIPYFLEAGIKHVCYGTLSGGLLSERMMGLASFDPENRSQVKYMQVLEDSLGWNGYQRLLTLLKDIADAHGVQLSHVATRYILDQPTVAATIIGVRNSKHVDDNLKIFSFDLTPAEKDSITALLDEYPRLEGDCYTLERESPRYKGIIHMNVDATEQQPPQAS